MDLNKTLPNPFRKPPTRLSLKKTPLGSSLPALNDPVKVLSALHQAREMFMQLNNSAEEERVRTASRAREESEESKKRLAYMRHLVKTPKRHHHISRSLEVWDSAPPEPPRRVYWSSTTDESQPGAREGATFTQTGTKLVLFGGSSHSIFSDTWILTEALQWRKLTVVEPEPRTGHCAVLFNQQIVVTGGETSFNQYSRHRDCLGTVSTFDPELCVWHQISTAGQGVAIRRYHCSADAGRYIFIHGGMSEKSQCLGDAAVLSLTSLKWKKVDLDGDVPGPRAFHTAVGVFMGARGQDVGREPGIYVFGGIDSAGVQHNSLHLVKQGSRACHWRLLPVHGIPPAARYQHSMTYFPGFNFFAVFGGRQDTVCSSGYRCFNDMHLFNLLTLTWTEVKQHGAVPEGRCSHAAAVFGSKLIVFGGIHNSHYCANSVQVAEMQEDRVESMVQDEKKRKSLILKFELFKVQHRKIPAGRMTRRTTRVKHTPVPMREKNVTFSVIAEERLNR